jgi:hypothetical protein
MDIKKQDLEQGKQSIEREVKKRTEGEGYKETGFGTRAKREMR